MCAKLIASIHADGELLQETSEEKDRDPQRERGSGRKLGEGVGLAAGADEPDLAVLEHGEDQRIQAGEQDPQETLR